MRSIIILQQIRPPRFEFEFDAALFPFDVHKPAFVVFAQFPPTYNAPTSSDRIPFDCLLCFYCGGSFPRTPPQRGLKQRRPPRLEFEYDAALLPFDVHKPANVVLAQGPPTYNAVPAL